MCGVFAIFSKESINAQHTGIARELTKLLKHRGPDSDGIWSDKKNGILLGHTRLAIIDLSEDASQPMERYGINISFNGELYNYKEIKAILEKRGYIFYSKSDTEVVLAAWHEWEDECFDKFDGMFVVAIWDKVKLVLASDHFGEKTLYYSKTKFGWLVCSELSAIKNVVDLDIDMGNEEISSFMSLGFIAGPKTAYKNTYRLMSSEIVHLYRDQTLHKRKYWTMPDFEEINGRVLPISENQLDDITDKLLTSLRRRMMSDVPMCLYLSSGVDSSLIAALLKKEMNHDISCVTVTFDGDNFHDESDKSKRIADYLDLDMHNVIISASEDLFLSKTLIDHYGQPFESSTSFAISRMTGDVSNKYKVGLTGIGGDEIFAGYGKHDFSYRYSKLLNLPDYIVWMFRKFNILDNNFISLLGTKRYQKYIALKNYPMLSTLSDIDGFIDWMQKKYPTIRSFDREIYNEELMEVLPNSRCISVDLGSMSSGVELRTPYLNKELLDLLATYDYRSLISFGQKRVLRDILKRYLPNSLVDTPKYGFTVPNKWLVEKYRGNSVTSALPSSIRNLNSQSGGDRNADRIIMRSMILSQFLNS